MSKRHIGKYRTNPHFRKLFELGDQVLKRIGIDPTTDSLSPVMVAYYRQVGFLPAGVLNALVRLGWSLDDQTEFLSLSEMEQKFSLERIIKSPAGLDPDKMMSFQSHWMSGVTASDRLAGCLPYLKQAGLIDNENDPDTRARVASVIELAGDRLRVYGDIFQVDEFFVSDDAMIMDEKNFQKRVAGSETTMKLLHELRNRLSGVTAFAAGPLHDLLQGYMAETQVKPGDLFPALRLCVTGKAQGADLFRTLELLGRECVLRRLERSLSTAAAKRPEQS